MLTLISILAQELLIIINKNKVTIMSKGIWHLKAEGRRKYESQFYCSSLFLNEKPAMIRNLKVPYKK